MTLKASVGARGRKDPADLGTCVTGLVNVVARGMAQIVSPHGLTHIDFALLRLFLGAEEWTNTQMALALPLAPSSISRTVTKLVDNGLVQRRRLLSDRRVVVLTLSQEGMTLTQDLHRRVQAYEADLCVSCAMCSLSDFIPASGRVKPCVTVIIHGLTLFPARQPGWAAGGTR